MNPRPLPNTDNRGQARGFTMVEVLVVLGVIMVLAAIGFGTYRSGVLSAKVASDSNALRQIGLARALYEEDSGPMRNLLVDHLVATKHVDAALVSGLADPSQDGYSNSFREYRRGSNPSRVTRIPAPASFRVSFISRGDYGPSDGMLAPRDGDRFSGWLISPAHGKPFDRQLEFFKGRYLRLCNDGAVVSREFLWHWIKVAGEEQYAHSVSAMFVDRDSGQGP